MAASAGGSPGHPEHSFSQLSRVADRRVALHQLTLKRPHGQAALIGVDALVVAAGMIVVVRLRRRTILIDLISSATGLGPERRMLTNPARVPPSTGGGT